MSAPPILDPAAGEWVFDSTTLVSCAMAPPLAGCLVACFSGRAHLVDEVLREVDRGPAGRFFRRVSWFRGESLVLQDDLALFARLRLRWGSQPDRDRGEAASIVVAKRNGWIFVTDDGTGYHAAVRLGVCTTRTPQLLVSLVRSSRMTPAEGWQALECLRRLGRQFGRLDWTGDEFRELTSAPAFDTC